MIDYVIKQIIPAPLGTLAIIKNTDDDGEGDKYALPVFMFALVKIRNDEYTNKPTTKVVGIDQTDDTYIFDFEDDFLGYNYDYVGMTEPTKRWKEAQDKRQKIKKQLDNVPKNPDGTKTYPSWMTVEWND